MVALLELGVLLFQTADVGKSGFIAAFCFFPLFRVLMGLGFGAFHQLLEIGIFLAGVLSGLLGSVGTVFLGLELGHKLLILFVSSDVTGKNGLLDHLRGAGLGRSIQQFQGLHVQNGLAFQLDVAELFGNSHHVVTSVPADTDSGAPLAPAALIVVCGQIVGVLCGHNAGHVAGDEGLRILQKQGVCLVVCTKVKGGCGTRGHRRVFVCTDRNTGCVGSSRQFRRRA